MDAGDSWRLALLVICLGLSGFFSASETAFIALPRARLMHLVRSGRSGADRVSHIIQRPERFLATVLLGNNLVNIMASALATSMLIALFGDAGVAYATIAMTLLVLIFAEILPKTYAFRNANQAARDVAPAVNILVSLLTPVTAVINFVVGHASIHFDGDLNTKAPILATCKR